jgi:hypothetical protein
MVEFEVVFYQEQWSWCFFVTKFKEVEFITCYLGEVNENPSDEEYTFKKINGKHMKSASGLLEDYWFGHLIQHGSGDQVNVTITAGYEIKAKKDIEIGEKLFMDYNRSIVCGKCEAESDFYDLCFKKSKKCYFCRNMCLETLILVKFFLQIATDPCLRRM